MAAGEVSHGRAGRIFARGEDSTTLCEAVIKTHPWAAESARYKLALEQRQRATEALAAFTEAIAAKVRTPQALPRPRGVSREQRPVVRRARPTACGTHGPPERPRSEDDDPDHVVGALLEVLVRLESEHGADKLLAAHVRQLARDWQVAA